MTANHRSTWPRRISLAALAVYWATLFVATHIPPSQQMVVRASDKLLHVAAFAGLSFLMALAWSLRGPFGWRQILAALAILLVYASVDEATQPLFGRHADWLDWAADLGGILGGMAVFCGAWAIWRRAAQPRTK